MLMRAETKRPALRWGADQEMEMICIRSIFAGATGSFAACSMASRKMISVANMMLIFCLLGNVDFFYATRASERLMIVFVRAFLPAHQKWIRGSAREISTPTEKRSVRRPSFMIEDPVRSSNRGSTKSRFVARCLYRLRLVSLL